MQKIRVSFPAVTLAAVLIFVSLQVVAEASPPVVTVLGPGINVRPGDATLNGSATASLRLARNEFESFQVAIEPSTSIADLQVSLEPGLSLPGGATIPNANVTIYREAYYDVISNGTLDTRSDAESSAGQWPDALIPQQDYIFGEDRPAFHETVPAGGRVVLWVDVLAPQGAPPGDYTGSLQISDGPMLLTSVPLTAHVENFGIPSTSTLDTLFLTGYNKPCLGHAPGDADPADDFVCSDWTFEESWKLHALYERVALENRITISNPWPIFKSQTLESNSSALNQTARFRKYVLPLIKGTSTDSALGSQIRLPGAQATVLSVLPPDESGGNACGTACINSWKTEATTDGILGKFVYYTCDEPFLNPGRWATCNATHTNISGPSGLPELVTGPIQQAQDPSLGNGADAWVDVMVPLLSMIANKPGSNYHPGNQRPAYNPWAGNAADGNANQMWLYSACNSEGCNGSSSADQDPPWNSTYWNGWAGYAIDQPASQARAMSWLAFEYDATGELYWQVAERLADAWKTCTQITNSPGQQGDCLYDSGGNGDGTLFYPGKACAPIASDRGCIGGTHDIPIESIRLKRIRDGREDYEYLHLLASNGAAAFAHATALDLFGPDLDFAAFSTTATDAEVATARTALANKIPGEASAHRQPDGWIKPASGSYRGSNIYNLTGAGQTVTSNSRRTRSRTFVIALQNDGDTSDRISVSGPTTPAGFVTRYFYGATDVTAKVGAGTFKTASIASGGTNALKLVVKVQRHAQIGDIESWLMTLGSVSDASKKDAVKAIVKVTR